ncbi:hypothetical protein GE09DRAFT_176181 [Coniochaeta sp. 2T2.1]|nr:hypothetical protein GE09DRAFT_176181 [Coniochaeta sp. 2T2.1]
MELAAFSDIEFVGIAADRQIVIDARRRARRSSRAGSSTISLASAGNEVERHDPTLTASALDIHEVFTVTPLSPSALVVDLVPDDLAMAADGGSDIPGLELGVPVIPSLSSSFGDALPLERYRRDLQRHERLAVSVALGQPCDLAQMPVFRRSPAPSPSPGRVVVKFTDYHENKHCDVAADEAVTAQSVADVDENDNQGLLRTYSLERWFESPIEKSQELAVELQQATTRSPQPEASCHQHQTSALLPQLGKHEKKNDSSITSIALDLIEPDPSFKPGENIDTDETLQAFNRGYYLQKERRGKARYRTYKQKTQRKRKSEDDHPQPRPRRPSPAQQADH